ncbi:MAG: hypothetical protein V4674_01005 [Patescibacteria group bacterium]
MTYRYIEEGPLMNCPDRAQEWFEIVLEVILQEERVAGTMADGSAHSV